METPGPGAQGVNRCFLQVSAPSQALSTGLCGCSRGRGNVPEPAGKTPTLRGTHETSSGVGSSRGRRPAGHNTAKRRTRVESRATGSVEGCGAQPPPPRFQHCWSRGDSADQPDCRVSGSRGARPQTGGRGRVQTTQLSERGRMLHLTAPHTWSESRVPQLEEHLPS